MNKIRPIFIACLAFGPHLNLRAQNQTPALFSEATIYSTLPSRSAHRPEMALDGDDGSYFRSVYGMSEGDDFTVLFSRPVLLRSLRVSTGTVDGDDLLTQGFVELSSDGTNYTRAATFNAAGVASAALNNRSVAALRVKVNANSAIPSLVLREIRLDSTVDIRRISWGAGRAFSDYSAAPDLKAWAAKADEQMARSWADTAALLYTDGFITPNKVNVFYKSGPDVTAVAATGGGEMTVNVAWARAHPEDTGLTVHEVAHVVQSMNAYDPVWLIEGTADYIRWVKFEPQNFTYNINPKTATYHDAYRTTAAFLAWCELHTDSRLVSKLNRDTRFGTYSNDRFQQYTGKNVDTLWSEFLIAYQADPKGVLLAPVEAADRPRAVPVVAANSSVPVVLTNVYNAVGLTRDGAPFDEASGFDDGGAAFSREALGKTVSARNVSFSLGEDGNNIVAARGEVIALPGAKFSSLWILGAATQGAQRGQNFVVTYADGTQQTLSQNLSDWFAPQEFPGETRAVRAAYRNTASGTKDARPFSLYAYGFALDATKTVQSLKLPENSKVKIAGVSLAR